MTAASFAATGWWAARLKRSRHTWLVVRKVTAVNLRAVTEYRGDTIFWILYGALWQTSTLIFATVLITRFSGLGGWPSIGILLIAGMRLLSHGLYVLIFMNVADIPRLVDEGLFDGYFLRPVPIFTQTMLSRFNINAVGDLLIAVPMCAYAVVHVDVAWTPGTALFLASAIVGAVLLEAGVQMIAASFLLRSPGTRVVFFFIDELFGTFGNYPLTILPWLLQGLLTFVLPLAFLAYFPVAVVLDLPPRTGFLSLLAHVAPLVGFGVFFAARRVWAHNLRAFVSVGG